MAENKMNIYQRMLAATSDINRVAKNLNVGFGQSSYKATGEADVLAAVKPIEEKYGIYSYPASRRIIDSGEMVSVKEFKGEKKESKQLYLRIETTYRFVNVDNPTEFIETVSYGDGVDTQDKAPGKAATYADKYALLKAYKIMTGDDPDQNASGDLRGYSKKSPDAKTSKITDKEIETLKSMCERAGRKVETVFPNGVENLTGSQYTQAVQTLNGWIQAKEGK